MSSSSNLDGKISKYKKKSKDLLVKMKERYLQDRGKPIKIALSLMTVLLVILAVNFRTRAYIVSLKGEVLGTIRDQKEVDLVLEELKEELKSTYEMDIVLNKDIRLEKTNVLDNSITDIGKIKDKLKKKVSFLVEGYILEVDGKEIAALRTDKEIDEVLEKIKEPFENEVKDILKDSNKLFEELDSQYKNYKKNKNEEEYAVKILEDIKVKKMELPIYKITNKEKLEEILLYGGEDLKKHTVEVGESLWTIAKIYDVTMDELIEANPDRDPDDLQIGDQVNLLKSKPLLTIATIIEVGYDREIEYETDVEEDNSKYTNEIEVKREGSKGRAIELVKEVRHNGQLVSKKVLDEEIIDKPVKKLLVQGTRETPKTIATGSFIMPTRGRISSRYGMRNGRMHRGLDIAASTGSPITAADGGRVVSAGWSGSYGKLVVIDHGNGYKTKYAHCSKIHVPVGARVYKGQHIANVGNTGRSTGPHLHLEVLKNGKNVNPSSFIGR